MGLSYISLKHMVPVTVRNRMAGLVEYDVF